MYWIGILWRSESGFAGVSERKTCRLTLPLVPTVYGGNVKTCCWSSGTGGLSAGGTKDWASGTGALVVIGGSEMVMLRSSICRSWVFVRLLYHCDRVALLMENSVTCLTMGFIERYQFSDVSVRLPNQIPHVNPLVVHFHWRGIDLTQFDDQKFHVPV